MTARSPRRLTRPRWLNVRVVGGIVLVVAAVVLGARVVGASSRTAPVWTASRDLAAGTVLTEDDLRPAEVNLGDTGSLYLGPGGDSPVGLVLGERIGQGSLLPAAAVRPVPDSRVVAIGVDPDRLPPGVVHGSVIDLYLTVEPTAGATIGGTTTDRVGGSLTVQAVTAPATGGLSGASSNQYQLAVQLPAAKADELVKLLPKGVATVVLVSGTS
ncbi:flagellar biosynthesis protein FlgA [Nakamurella flava]|uniref:Flagellar biosynthesis protein FlgA n=1 Tax=Nakamurella flava TaxID=2576308 RepID=A0A4U6QLR9_9ACTN|nr:SAF domain-containing protein [Nakamurella flava]TKV61504.1 flagellar biosynthesis protein FlgA [Nakamurella flava]